MIIKSIYILFLVPLLISVFLYFNHNFSSKDDGSNSKDTPNNHIDQVKNNTNTSKENMELQKKKVAGEDSVAKTDYMTLHFDAILVDTHNDFIYKVYEKGAEFGKENSFTQSDLPRFKSGGLDVQVFSIWIPMNQVKRSYDFVISRIDKLKEIEDGNSSEFEFAKTYDDIIRIVKAKKVCGLIGIEGGTAIGSNLDNINTFYDLGVRYIGLTWNNSNLIATSARDATERGKQGGLTEFGIKVVQRMNETGMLIDVSHLSEAGFWDVIENTNSPVIASHSDCYSINPHYRNLTDEQIIAIGKNGGYIGVNFYDKFLHSTPSKATLETVIDHIDHITNLIGVNYIGIGSDFDGGITAPEGLTDVTYYPEITRRLVEKGYSPEDVRKILGENFLRVFKQVCK